MDGTVKLPDPVALIAGLLTLVAATLNVPVVPGAGRTPVGTAHIPISPCAPAGIRRLGRLPTNVKPGGGFSNDKLNVSAAGPVLLTKKSKTVGTCTSYWKSGAV